MLFFSGWIPRGSDIWGNVKHPVVWTSEWPGSRVNASYIVARRSTLYIRRGRGWTFRIGSPSLQQTEHQLTQSCSPQSTAYRDPQRRSLFQDTNQYKIRQNTDVHWARTLHDTWLSPVRRVSFSLSSLECIEHEESYTTNFGQIKYLATLSHYNTLFLDIIARSNRWIYL